jgi:DNA-binding SARP family transcriptional activator/tetratricopeptide (TPR) repeat protein
MLLGLLGPLHVEHEGRVMRVTAAKQRVILAALLVRVRQVVSSDQLADLVWDGTHPTAARATLRSHVRGLRRALGAVGSQVVTRAPGYLIDAADDEIDLLQFSALVSTADQAIRSGEWQQAQAALREARTLWRGQPLSDIPSESLRGEVVPRLEEEFLQAAEMHITAGLHLGQAAALLPELRALVAQHPLRERFHAQLMLALYRSGRQAEALNTYQQIRKVLIEELGVEPGADLRGLHQRILVEDPGLMIQSAVGNGRTAGDSASVVTRPQSPSPNGQRSHPLPRQLPAAPWHFAGRASELKALWEGLERAESRPGSVVILAIEGMAGVGKTTLAVHWAHQAADRFPDGQLFVNLRSFGPSGPPAEPTRVIRSFLASLGVPLDQLPADPEALAALYRSVLSDKRVLIVLDNAGDAGQVRPLLPGCPGCLVLVTSRGQLTGLVITEGAHLRSLDVLTEPDAQELLARRLGTGRLAAEPPAAAELGELCGRLPLALAIVASRAVARPDLPLATLADELRSEPERLDVLDSGDEASSVRTVFSWSYRQLTEPAARMFRLLAAHPGPDISAPAAASLAGMSPGCARRTRTELVGAHMLAEPVLGRYVIHDLLRSYGAEQACGQDSQAEQDDATGRFLDHYWHTAHQAARLLQPERPSVGLGPARPGATPEPLADREQALAWFEAEHHVLVAAVTRAAQAGFDSHAWQIPWAMAAFLDWRGYWHDMAATQGIALGSVTRLGDRAGQAIACRLLAMAWTRLGDYDQARCRLADCLALYRQLGDTDGEARAHLSLGWLAEQQGRYRDALSHCQQALALRTADGNLAGQASAGNSLGWCHVLLGDYLRAREICRQALALHHELGNRHGEAHAWDNIGCAERNLGNLGAATECYRRALGLFQELGHRYYEADVLGRLGDTLLAAGDRQESRAVWQRAADILDDLHHPDAVQIRDKIRRLSFASPG